MSVCPPGMFFRRKLFFFIFADHMVLFVGACPENAQIDVYTLYTHALVIEQIFRLNANVVHFCVNIRGDGVSGEPWQQAQRK